MKYNIIITLFYIIFIRLNTQSQTVKINILNIDSCYVLAEKNYPLINQYELIDKSKEYTIKNLNKQYFPQFSVQGTLTYQSEVTEVPIPLPNVDIIAPPKNQYIVYSEVSQSISNLITNKTDKEAIKTNSEIDKKNIKIQLYKLRERINNLYFGILLIDEQKKQLEFIMQDIESGIKKVTIAIENGTSLKNNLYSLNAEKLILEQKIIELKSNRKAFNKMLSHFIGKEIDEQTKFEMPTYVSNTNEINRLEFIYFDLKHTALNIQKKRINNKLIPKLSVFFQGGMGLPALNFLNNKLSGYYITGLRLKWNLNELYTLKNNKKLIDINREKINVQKNIFIFNTDLNVKQQNEEIVKLNELIEADIKIVENRERVVLSVNNQLENGIVTTNEYITAVNSKNEALQTLSLHRIQLQKTYYNLKTITGN